MDALDKVADNADKETKKATAKLEAKGAQKKKEAADNAG